MPDETLDRSSLGRLVRALRQERVQRSFSVDDIGRFINIRSTHIEKLEEGDFSFLPPLYVFSYLKKYANELGVGDDTLLEACRNELQVPVSNFSVPPTAQVVMENTTGSALEPQGHGKKKMIVALVITAAVILIGLAIYYLSGQF
jgi:cytoskeletal protein RodZ